MSDAELIREALDNLRHEIDMTSLKLAEYEKAFGEDPIAHALADAIITGRRLERRYRRMLVNEEYLV